jgi:hypothetical protein
VSKIEHRFGEFEFHKQRGSISIFKEMLAYPQDNRADQEAKFINEVMLQ